MSTTKRKGSFRLGIDGGPTFGQMLRGCRLGYRWHPILKAMVRISDAGSQLFTVQMCPPDRIPVGKGRSEDGKHRCWWESAEGYRMLGMSRAIVEHAEPKAFVQFTIDENGDPA